MSYPLAFTFICAWQNGQVKTWAQHFKNTFCVNGPVFEYFFALIFSSYLDQLIFCLIPNNKGKREANLKVGKIKGQIMPLQSIK